MLSREVLPVKEEFSPSKVAIILSTRYKKWKKQYLPDVKETDIIRGNLALKTIKTAIRQGYVVYVSNSPYSSPEFTQELNKTGAHIITRPPEGEDKSDLASSFLFGVAQASKYPGVKVLVLAQAEKQPLIKHLPVLATPIIKKEVSIVTPVRERKESERSYPDYMVQSETRGLRYSQRIIRILLGQPAFEKFENEKEYDLFFGVGLFRNDPELLGKILARFITPGAEFKDSTYYPIYNAIATGLGVMPIKIPFKYPWIQKLNEQINYRSTFKKKRANQLTGTVVGIIRLARLLLQEQDSSLYTADRYKLRKKPPIVMKRVENTLNLSQFLQ